MKYFIIYIFAISVVSIIVCCYDKLGAKYQKGRISEKTIILFSFFGGAVAMYFTMRIIRHKTLHNKFMIGLPLIILAQVVIFGIFINKFTLK